MFKRKKTAPTKPDTSHLDEMDSWGPEMFEDCEPSSVVHMDDHTYVLGCGKGRCHVDHWSK